MRLIFISGSNVVIWVSDNLRNRLIFIFFLIRENVGSSFFLCLKRVPSSPPVQACKAYLKRVYIQKKDQINVCLRQWNWAVKRVWEATGFFWIPYYITDCCGQRYRRVIYHSGTCATGKSFFPIFEEI